MSREFVLLIEGATTEGALFSLSSDFDWATLDELPSSNLNAVAAVAAMGSCAGGGF